MLVFLAVFRGAYFLDVLHPSGSYTLSTSSSSGLPELYGERFDGDIPFRTECSKVSHSLHIVQSNDLGGNIRCASLKLEQLKHASILPSSY